MKGRNESLKFSVIVAVYNVEAYIENCIRSLLAQTKVELEIIVVDDGSTDRSGIICDQFADVNSNIRVIHKKNGGLSDARNCGIREARGDYILFVDGDDSIRRDSIKSIEKEIIDQEYPDIVFLECTKVLYGKDKRMSRKILMMDGVDQKVRHLNRKGLLAYISKLPKYPASACTKAIKRTLFLENDLEFEYGLFSEDLEWALRLFLYIDSAGYCSNEYYLYRQGRKGSISATPCEKGAFDKLHIVEKWIDSMNDFDSQEEKMIIRSMMEYVFRFLIIDISYVSRYRVHAYKKRVRRCEEVLGIREDRASRLIRASYKYLGMEITNKLLHVYLKARKY